MSSILFCGTLEIENQNSSQKEVYGHNIKLYKIKLSNYYEIISDLFNILSNPERERANRYHFEKDKQRFVICRSLLKYLLAEHTGLNLNQIIIDRDSNKKPFLATHPSIFFNVSHAGGYALIAISKSKVGVDVEYINRAFDFQEILLDIFNSVEIDEVRQSNDPQRLCYQFWTRKEAIVKALGKGIDDDFSNIPVTDGFHVLPSDLLGNSEQIQAVSFSINDDHIGALAFTKDTIFESIVWYPLPTSNQLKLLLF